MRWLLFPGLLGVLMVLVGGCSKKNNTPALRQWEAFNTRYNVYFNGKEHFDEELADMEKSYEDDYAKQLPLHPAEAYANPKLPQPSGDFSRTLEKMQKAIELHSITHKPAFRPSNQKERDFRNRDEFNPFIHNAWLTMGKAQYYSGDFTGAAATFLYITRHFRWLPETLTEARLWEALSYCAAGLPYDAENALHLVKEDDLTNKDLRHLYNLTMASYFIHSGKDQESIPFLKEAAQHSHGVQAHRLWYLLGQICFKSGKKEMAYVAFQNAGAGLSTPYPLKFNARIKQSEVFTGSDITSEIKALKGLTKYERNREFLDQINYAIANLYLTEKDSTAAEEYYQKAIKESSRNGIDEAYAKLALSNLYYSQREYLKSQPLLSEALPFLGEDYPRIKTLQTRSENLDELALYAGNVQLQDSLLELSRLPKEKQIEIIRKQIKREEEAQKAQNKRQSVDTVSSFTVNYDDSWYFYNTNAKNRGKNEFIKKWGSRKLEDDWRRSNKLTFNMEETYAEEGESQQNLLSDSVQDQSLNNRDRLLQSYLDQIPSTQEQITLANDVVQQGLYNQGIILKDKIEDYASAEQKFRELLERYPDNVYRLDIYYNLYLMAGRQENFTKAEEWRKLILSEFPESPYGIAMKDPDYFNRLKEMNSIQEELYTEAYKAYLANDNGKVHELTQEMEKSYPLSSILPKFVFIDALAYLTDGNHALFRTKLMELLQRWPDTDMTDMASGIMKRLNSGMQPVARNENPRGMLWQTVLSDNPEVEVDLEEEFTNEPDSPQYFVLIFPRDAVNPNLVLYEEARFNFSTFLIKDFDLEPMSFSNVSLLVIKGFANLKEVEKYRKVMDDSDIDLPSEVESVIISKQNFELLLRSGKTFEDYFRHLDSLDDDTVD